jgi:cathepsin B
MIKPRVDVSVGVYRHTYGAWVGGHAMKLIGWGREKNRDYWLIANSWGTDWGINGFLKFARGENHLDIEEYLVTAIPQTDKSLDPLADTGTGTVA